MKRILLISISIFMLSTFVLVFTSCKKDSTDVTLPSKVSLVEDKSQPLLKVYDINTKEIKEMELEQYLQGVLAGEIFNNWELEALKAQAILARTYTLYFLQNNQSKYDGADISNDVSEAQAYDETKINDSIKQAVLDTKGLVATVDKSLIETYFHSNSGGVTTTAKNGLNFSGDEKYTKIVSSPENEQNSENFAWSETFSKSEILAALRAMGLSVSNVSNMQVGIKDESGRAKTFVVGDTEFDANTFRLKIGSTKLKSTLIENIVVSSSKINISGKGYGHGVGMSQWGAKILAEQGKGAEDIIKYYFENVEIVTANY